MKPIRLQAKNIGPHAQLDVDFRDYADSLFLISGDTGSGKTTIFDLLVTALYYNNAQFKIGDKRFIDLRSEFASFSAKEPSSVILDFSHRGKTYRVERSWTPKRVAWDPERSFNSLFRDQHLFSEIVDGQLVGPSYTKIGEVTQAIEDLLHLNKDQFQRILLLPQHNFKRFLLANSKEKEEILQTLFDVDSYQFLIEQLKEKRKQDRQQMEARDLEMILLARSVVGEDLALLGSAQIQEAMTEALQTFEQEKKQGERKVLNLEAQVQELAEKLAAWKQRQDWEQALACIQAEFKQVETAYPTYEVDKAHLALLDNLEGGQILLDRQEQLDRQEAALSRRATQLEQDQQELEALNQTYVTEQADLGQEDEEELRRQIAELEGAYQKLLDRQQLSQLLASKQDELGQLQDQQLALQQELEASQGAVAQLETGLQSLSQKPVSWNQLVDYQQRHHQLLQQDQRIKAQEAELAQLQSQLEEVQLQLENLPQSSDHHAFQHQRLAYAVDLVRGQTHLNEPCLVCHNQVTELPQTSAAGMEADYVQAELAYYGQKAQLAHLGESQTKLEQQSAQVLSRLEELQAVYQTALSDFATDLETDQIDLTGLAQALQAYQTSLESQLKQVENLRQEKETALLRQNQHLLNLQEISLRMDHTGQQIQENSRALEKLEMQIGTQTIQEVEVALKNEQERLKQYQTATARLAQLELQLTAHRQAFETRQEQYAEMLQSHQEAQAKNRSALLKLQEDFLPQVELAAFLDILQEVPLRGQLRQKITQFEGRLQEIQHELNRLQSQEPPNLSLDNPQEQEARLAQLQSDLSLEQEALILIVSRIDHALTVEQQLTALTENQLESQLLYEQLDQLVQVLAGQTESRLDIKGYVLQHFFNQIVEVANERYYQDFSQGRYQFVLNAQKTSGRSLSGLELDVLDQEVGQLRPVSTLSGGESFLASMALALATSDVIQESKGGVELEALFIDEGFGSLDQETLLVALDVLESLGRSGRMIGLISHVEVMKQGISKQILVEKRGSGRSSLKQVSL